MVGVHQCTVHADDVSRTFSTAYYVIVVLGGGLVIALQGVLTSPGDTYGGLVLGLLIILIGCLLPLFAAQSEVAEGPADGPAEVRGTAAVELTPADALEPRASLSDDWNLPL